MMLTNDNNFKKIFINALQQRQCSNHYHPPIPNMRKDYYYACQVTLTVAFYVWQRQCSNQNTLMTLSAPSDRCILSHIGYASPSNLSTTWSNRYGVGVKCVGSRGAGVVGFVGNASLDVGKLPSDWVKSTFGDSPQHRCQCCRQFWAVFYLEKSKYSFVIFFYLEFFYLFLLLRAIHFLSTSFNLSALRAFNSLRQLMKAATV